MITSLSPENLEKIFLFEIYVETLKIDYPKLCFTQNYLDSLKEVTIQFQFLGFKPVEIKEEEFTKPTEQGECGDRKVMAGKSCLFSLRDMPKEVRCLEIDAAVMRKTEPGPTLTLGKACIQLGENFANILQELKPKKLSASVKKFFCLYDKDCKEVGRICVSINLSCFGNMITTSFQLDGEDSKAYVVQPGGEVPMKEFISKSEESYEKGVCPAEFAYGKLLGGASGIRWEAGSPPMYMYQGGSAPAKQGGWQGLMGGMPPATPLGGRTKASPFCGKVSVGKASSSSSEDQPPPQMPNLSFCGCDYPLPPMFPPPPPPRKKKKKKKPCPMGLVKDFCQNPGCPKGYPSLPVFEERQQVCQAMDVPPGTFGLKGTQMVFQMPMENQPLPGNRNARFSFGGGIDSLNDVRIMKDGEVKKYSVPTRQEDIFVMKVGKTNQESDQRHRMVLEIKQPKHVIDEKICTDIRTQYLEADFIPEAPKKKEGKGKKGKKDKKGKKGKKKK